MDKGKRKTPKKADWPAPPRIKWKHGPPPDDGPLAYATWTNKGGVGKTTLTFQLSARFAERAKEDGWNVLVIDLCPQANVSMTLLQSEGKPGSEVVEHYMNEILATTRSGSVGYASAARRQKPQSSKGVNIYQTVAGWLLARRDKGDPGIQDLKVVDFLVHPNDHNENIPDNLYLVCGDMDLEIVSSAIVDYRDHMKDKWTDITFWIGHLVKDLCSEDEKKHWAVFIDTNPSMNFYTQLALAAARYLIVPVNADDYSEQAVKALFRHVYDVDVNHDSSRQRFPKDMDKGTFAKKAIENHLELPKVQVMINNRAVPGHAKSESLRDGTNKQAPTAARASRSMGERICAQLLQAFEVKEQKGWQYFVRGASMRKKLGKMKKFALDQEPSRTQQSAIKEAFNEHYLKTLHDFMSTAVLSGTSGKPLSRLRGAVRISDSADSGIPTNRLAVHSCLGLIDDLIDEFLVRFDHEEHAGEDEGATSLYGNSSEGIFEEMDAFSFPERDDQDRCNTQPCSKGLGSSSRSGFKSDCRSCSANQTTYQRAPAKVKRTSDSSSSGLPAERPQRSSKGLGSSSRSGLKKDCHSSSAEQTSYQRAPAKVKRTSDSSNSGLPAKRRQRSFDHEEHAGEDGGTSQGGNRSEGLFKEPGAFSSPERDDQDQSKTQPCPKGLGSSSRSDLKSDCRSSSANQTFYRRTPAKVKRTNDSSSSGLPAKCRQRSPSSPAIVQLQIHDSDSDSDSENVQGGGGKHRDDGSDDSSDGILSQPVF